LRSRRQRILILPSERLLVGDNNMDHFEVFHHSMQVSKMDTAAGEIAAQFILTVQNIDGVVNRTTIAFYRPELEVVGI
jgi:hypothetical protein